MIKLGINGFGRIGRLAARVAIRRGDMDLIAINAPDKTPDQIAYVFAHDSVHGKWEGTVEYDESHLIINGKAIQLLNSRDPSKLGWGDLGVEYVAECTGAFLTEECVEKSGFAHIRRTYNSNRDAILQRIACLEAISKTGDSLVDGLCKSKEFSAIGKLEVFVVGEIKFKF